MRVVQGKLVIPASHEVNELACVIARALYDGRLAELAMRRRDRLREIALELSLMSTELGVEEDHAMCHPAAARLLPW